MMNNEWRAMNDHVRCQMSDVRCQMSDVSDNQYRYLASIPH
jgi:hypothetical protein